VHPRAQNICSPPAYWSPSSGSINARVRCNRSEASFSPDGDSSLRTDGAAERRGEPLRRIRWTGYRKSMRRVPHRAPSIGRMRTVVPRVDPTTCPLRLAVMPTCLCEWCECECECELECPAHTHGHEQGLPAGLPLPCTRAQRYGTHTRLPIPTQPDSKPAALVNLRCISRHATVRGWLLTPHPRRSSDHAMSRRSVWTHACMPYIETDICTSRLQCAQLVAASPRRIIVSGQSRSPQSHRASLYLQPIRGGEWGAPCNGGLDAAVRSLAGPE